MSSFKEFLSQSETFLTESDTIPSAVIDSMLKEVNPLLKGMGLSLKASDLTKTFKFLSLEIKDKKFLNFAPGLFKEFFVQLSSYKARDEEAYNLVIEYSWKHDKGGSNGLHYGVFWFDSEGKVLQRP